MCQETTRIPTDEDTVEVFGRDTCDGRKELVLVDSQGREHPVPVKLRQTGEQRAVA